ncbi:MAG: acyltransferase [Pirellulales bacterium]|nr:acyltransferase [Pirellulales bacterium]
MKRHTRLDGLDGLRAIACLAVFGVHFQQITFVGRRFGPVDLGLLLENGNRGVCLFFVLTGFLLSLPFWKTGEKPATGVMRQPGWLTVYARHRMARILPAYLLCLTVLVVKNADWRAAHGPADVMLHLLFLQNFTEFSIYNISAPFWALAVIVQFYVVFPILIVGLRPLMRSNALALGAVAIAVVAAYFAHAALLSWAQTYAGDWPLPTTYVRPDGFVLTHSLLAHLPHFLIGVFAAGIFLGMSRRNTTGAAAWGFDAVFWLAAGAILVILCVPELNDRLTIPHGRYNLPYVPLLVAVLIVCTPQSRSARAVLELAPVRALGLISYGIYIYHLPCLKLIARVMRRADAPPGDHWLLFATASLALSIVVAGASYILLERPVLRWAKRRRSE